MRKEFIWGICLVLVVLANPLHSFSTTRSRLSFDSLQTLAPGATTKDSFKKSFGLPDDTSTNAEAEYWRYNVNGYEQLGASFNKNTGILEAFHWRVGAGEREQMLENSLARFPEAKWTPELDDWVHAHFFPDDCYFRDHHLGVTVHYQINRKEVSSISRWIPNARTVSDLGQKEAPPKFCWGDDERTCSNYTPGKEWQKQFKTCEPELKRALPLPKK